MREPGRHLLAQQLFERDLPDPLQGLQLAAALRAPVEVRPDLDLPRVVEPAVEEVLERGAEVIHRVGHRSREVPLP